MTWRRDLLVVIGGNALCLVLLGLGTYLMLRVTPVGSLLAESWPVRDDPVARSDVLSRYPDPYGLLMDAFPFWLAVLGCTVAILVGGAVGRLALRRAFWLPLAAVAPLTASPLLIGVYAADVWLRAVLWGLLAWLAAAFVRWRRARPA